MAHTFMPRWAAIKILAHTRLPLEIMEHIFSYAYPTARHRSAGTSALLGPAPYYTPPLYGACPFMQLPTELRRAIFAESLVAKYEPIQPKCADEAYYSSKAVTPSSKRSGMSRLMTLNRTIRDEIAEVVYEERIFVIHVHEGLLNGGIEFIDAGRQPLHFQDCPSDDRFWKFCDTEKDFGFRRLKKICIQIYPSTDDNTRHCAINTYFTNLALVRQLHRSGEEEHRITNLTIQFMDPRRTGLEQGRKAIQRAEQYWWDPEMNQPRETSIHGVPDVEIVLRPFANLTSCHSVDIQLPSRLANDARVAVFVQNLKASMTSRYGLSFANDDLDRNIEAGRSAMEEYTFSLKHGIKHREVDSLTQDDMQDPMDLDEDDLDSSADQPSKKRRKKAMLPWNASRPYDATVVENEENDMSEDELSGLDLDLCRAIEESLMSTPNHSDGDYGTWPSYQGATMSLSHSAGLQALGHESLPATQASNSTSPPTAARSWAQIAALESASNASRLSISHVGAQFNANSSHTGGQQPVSAPRSFADSTMSFRVEQQPMRMSPPEMHPVRTHEVANGKDHFNGGNGQPQGGPNDRATSAADRKKPRKLQVRSGNATMPYQ